MIRYSQRFLKMIAKTRKMLIEAFRACSLDMGTGYAHLEKRTNSVAWL